MVIVRVVHNLNLTIHYHGNILLTILMIKFTLLTTIPILSVIYVLCMKKLSLIISPEIYVEDLYFAKL